MNENIGKWSSLVSRLKETSQIDKSKLSEVIELLENIDEDIRDYDSLISKSKKSDEDENEILGNILRLRANAMTLSEYFEELADALGELPLD